MKNKITFLLMTVVFLNEIIWAGVIPIFHSPDEQFHYAYTQYLAEHTDHLFTRILELSKNNIYSQELEKTLNYLDSKSVLSQPDNKPDFLKSPDGPNEEKIIHLSETSRKTPSRKIKMLNDNPPLYYLIGALFYQASPVKNLIWRVYFLRIFSIICFLLTVLFSIKISELIFAKEKLLIIVVTIIISFMPMVSFISASVNNQNLSMILLTLAIYFLIKDIKMELKLKEVIILAIILALAFLTKPDSIIIFFSVIPFLLVNQLIKKKKIELTRIIIFLSVFFLISGPWYLKDPANRNWVAKLPFQVIRNNPSIVIDLQEKKTSLKDISYYVYFKLFLGIRSHDFLKSFWGSFGWLDINYPKTVYWLLHFFSAICLIGFSKYMLSCLKKKKEFTWLWESTFLVTVFILSLSYVEWQYYQVYKSFMLQGRYIFPIISILAIFIVLGWKNIFPRKFQKKALIFLMFIMIFFNFYSLFFIVLPRYYPIDRYLFLSLSQYKPEFLKGIIWPFLIISYLFLLAKLVKKMLKIYQEN